MIPTDPTERKEMIRYMLSGCLLKKDELSKWEQDFIDSIEEQFEEHGQLSIKQADKLEQIYDKL